MMKRREDRIRYLSYEDGRKPKPYRPRFERARLLVERAAGWIFGKLFEQERTSEGEPKSKTKQGQEAQKKSPEEKLAETIDARFANYANITKAIDSGEIGLGAEDCKKAKDIIEQMFHRDSEIWVRSQRVKEVQEIEFPAEKRAAVLCVELRNLADQLRRIVKTGVGMGRQAALDELEKIEKTAWDSYFLALRLEKTAGHENNLES